MFFFNWRRARFPSTGRARRSAMPTQYRRSPSGSTAGSTLWDAAGRGQPTAVSTLAAAADLKNSRRVFIRQSSGTLHLETLPRWERLRFWILRRSFVSVESVAPFPAARRAFGQARIHPGVVGAFAEARVNFLLQGQRG